MNPQDYPYCVWEHRIGGRVLRYFADEYLAGQWIINNGGQIVPNPNTF